ncbi:hypothetical protein L209DRAFT_18967 [Thermothelomyces heterothallicus CBS 203.75]
MQPLAAWVPTLSSPSRASLSPHTSATAPTSRRFGRGQVRLPCLRFNSFVSFARQDLNGPFLPPSPCTHSPRGPRLCFFSAAQLSTRQGETDWNRASETCAKGVSGAIP